MTEIKKENWKIIGPGSSQLKPKDVRAIVEMQEIFDDPKGTAIKKVAKLIGKKLAEQKPEGWGINTEYPFKK